MNRITELVESGYEVQVGPHVGLKGYWATVFRVRYCDTDCWDDSGHSYSVSGAIEEALEIWQTGCCPRLDPEDF